VRRPPGEDFRPREAPRTPQTDPIGPTLRGGGALGALGSALAIWWTSSTATTPTVSLADLASNKPPSGTQQVLGDKTLLAGRDSVSALSTEYEEALKERRETYADHQLAPTDNARKIAAQEADARAASLNADVRGLLEVAQYTTVAQRWSKARFAILGAGVVAAVGIGLFAWAADPPRTLSPA
jgi:hypothetical protein